MLFKSLHCLLQSISLQKRALCLEITLSLLLLTAAASRRFNPSRGSLLSFPGWWQESSCCPCFGTSPQLDGDVSQVCVTSTARQRSQDPFVERPAGKDGSQGRLDPSAGGQGEDGCSALGFSHKALSCPFLPGSSQGKMLSLFPMESPLWGGKPWGSGLAVARAPGPPRARDVLRR